MADENKPAEGFMSNFGMIMPTTPVKMKKNVKIFGWYILWTGINVRIYKRITPVRQDWIFDFFCWKFVKPIGRKSKNEWSGATYNFTSYEIKNFNNETKE